jgi:hypothetical protein
MRKVLKATEDYKWILHDEYYNWYNQALFGDFNKTDIVNFIDIFQNNQNTKLNDKLKGDYLYSSPRLNYIFLNGNYYFRNINLKEHNHIFITRGMVFGISGNRYDYMHHCLFYANSEKLYIITVTDKENKIKFLIDTSVKNANFIKSFKACINSSGYNSRKDIVYLENLHDMFFDSADELSPEVPYECTTSEYIESVKDSVLSSLQNNSTLNKSILDSLNIPLALSSTPVTSTEEDDQDCEDNEYYGFF